MKKRSDDFLGCLFAPFQLLDAIFQIVDLFIGKKKKFKPSQYETERRTYKTRLVNICTHCGAETYIKSELCPFCNKPFFGPLPWKKIGEFTGTAVIFVMISVLSGVFLGNSAGNFITLCGFLILIVYVYNKFRNPK